MFSEYIEPGIPPLIFWSFCAIGILIQGISKSGFAGGVGILTLPMMMLVMPVQLVPAVLLPLLILCDFNAIYHHWHNKDWRPIRAIMLPTLIGIVLGAVVWWYVGKDGAQHYGGWLKRFVGIIAIVFALYILAKEAALQWVERLSPGRFAAWGTGLSAGFCSTIAHAAGPIIGLYMFAQGMGKSLFVGTVAWTFTLINMAKLPFYVGIGLIKLDTLLFDLTLVTMIPIGSWMGHWMHHRVSERIFNRTILVFVFIAGLQLLLNVNFVLKIAEMGWGIER